MLGPDALVCLLDEVDLAECKRVRVVGIWAVFGDCLLRERRGSFGWGHRHGAVWGASNFETRAERKERRSWFKRITPARRAAAEAHWNAVADGGETHRLLGMGIKQMLVEIRVYEVVACALPEFLPRDLVRAIWAHIGTQDPWEELDRNGDCFLKRLERARQKCAPRAAWKLTTRRERVRGRWTHLALRLLPQLHSFTGFVFQKARAWHVLAPWCLMCQPWRVGQTTPTHTPH